MFAATSSYFWLSLFFFLFSRPTLLREQHYQYLKKGLRHLSDAYEVSLHEKNAKCMFSEPRKHF